MVIVREAIKRRAHQIRHDADYIGMFEWVVWAWLVKARVLLMFGTSVIDVYHVFGSGVPALNMTKVYRVAAVQFIDVHCGPRIGQTCAIRKRNISALVGNNMGKR